MEETNQQFNSPAELKRPRLTIFLLCALIVILSLHVAIGIHHGGRFGYFIVLI